MLGQKSRPREEVESGSTSGPSPAARQMPGAAPQLHEAVLVASGFSFRLAGGKLPGLAHVHRAISLARMKLLGGCNMATLRDQAGLHATGMVREIPQTLVPRPADVSMLCRWPAGRKLHLSSGSMRIQNRYPPTALPGDHHKIQLCAPQTSSSARHLLIRYVASSRIQHHDSQSSLPRPSRAMPWLHMLPTPTGSA